MTKIPVLNISAILLQIKVLPKRREMGAHSRGNTFLDYTFIICVALKLISSLEIIVIKKYYFLFVLGFWIIYNCNWSNEDDKGDGLHAGKSPLPVKQM